MLIDLPKIEEPFYSILRALFRRNKNLRGLLSSSTLRDQ